MATITNRLAFLISANADSAIKAFNQTAVAADKELGKAQRKVDQVGASLTKFGAAGLATAGTLGVGLVKMGQDASDLAESMSKTRVVFGETADEIVTFAEAAAGALGLSKKAALDAAADFALFGQSAGLTGKDINKFSTGLVALSADFASFKNTTPEDAIIAIGAALRGEYEPIRRYNILLNEQVLKNRAAKMEIYSGNGALTAQQKVLAANAEIYAQSTKLQGDFARTSSGLANQQRILTATNQNLSASIGQGVLPVMQRVTGFATDAASQFTKLDVATGGVVGTMAGFGVAGLGVVSALSLVAGQTIRARDNFRDADGELTKLGATAKYAGIALATIAVAETAGAAVQQLGGFAQETDKRLNTLITTAGKTGSTKDLTTAFANLADQLKNADTGVGAFFKQFGKAIRVAGADTDAGRIAIEYLDEAFAQLAAKSPDLAQKVIDALKAQSKMLDQSGATYKDNTMLIERYTKTLLNQKAATDTLTKAEEDRAAAELKAKAQAEAAAEATEKLQKKVGKLTDAVSNKLNNALEVAKTNLQKARDEFDSYAKSISSSITSTLSFSSAQQNAGQNTENLRSATQEVADAQMAFNQAMASGDYSGITSATQRLTTAQENLTKAQKAPKTFIDSLKAQESSAVTFANNIQKLLDLGAKQGLIDQLASSGAEAGNAIASEILSSANPAQYVDQVNGIISNTQSIADQVAKNSASKFKQAGIDSATQLLVGMNTILAKSKISLKFANLNKKGKPIKSLKDLTDQLQESLTGVFSVAGFGQDTIPQLADGGVVRARSGGTLALLGEGGRDEAVIPLPAPSSMGGTNISITVQTGVGDPVAIGAAVVDVLQKYQSRTGSLPLKVR